MKVVCHFCTQISKTYSKKLLKNRKIMKKDRKIIEMIGKYIKYMKIL